MMIKLVIVSVLCCIANALNMDDVKHMIDMIEFKPLIRFMGDF